MKHDLIRDEQAISVEELMDLPHASILPLQDVIGFLASPDSGIQLTTNGDLTELTDGETVYRILGGLPILYPSYVAKYPLGEMPLVCFEDSRLQYFLLSQLKQQGEVNAPSSNVHYQRHLFRMREFVSGCRGVVLDVGCDDVKIGASLFAKGCSYVGLDPSSRDTGDFRVVGVGELLPFRDESVDNVVFNTSLDHIMDYHQAIDEAYRVLKPGGRLFVSTLIWTANATLLSDSVHFHHFRDYEIRGALRGEGRAINVEIDYSYKGDLHRYGKFIMSEKVAGTGNQ